MSPSSPMGQAFKTPVLRLCLGVCSAGNWEQPSRNCTCGNWSRAASFEFPDPIQMARPLTLSLSLKPEWEENFQRVLEGQKHILHVEEMCITAARGQTVAECFFPKMHISIAPVPHVLPETCQSTIKRRNPVPCP